jgi:hypothetical protein
MPSLSGPSIFQPACKSLSGPIYALFTLPFEEYQPVISKLTFQAEDCCYKTIVLTNLLLYCQVDGEVADLHFLILFLEVIQLENRIQILPHLINCL